jgi:hypothetical protein
MDIENERRADGGRAEASRRMLIEAWTVIAAHHGVRLSDGPPR